MPVPMSPQTPRSQSSEVFRLRGLSRASPSWMALIGRVSECRRCVLSVVPVAWIRLAGGPFAAARRSLERASCRQTGRRTRVRRGRPRHGSGLRLRPVAASRGAASSTDGGSRVGRLGPLEACRSWGSSGTCHGTSPLASWSFLGGSTLRRTVRVLAFGLDCREPFEPRGGLRRLSARLVRRRCACCSDLCRRFDGDLRRHVRSMRRQRGALGSRGRSCVVGDAAWSWSSASLSLDPLLFVSRRSNSSGRATVGFLARVWCRVAAELRAPPWLRRSGPRRSVVDSSLVGRPSPCRLVARNRRLVGAGMPSDFTDHASASCVDFSPDPAFRRPGAARSQAADW